MPVKKFLLAIIAGRNKKICESVLALRHQLLEVGSAQALDQIILRVAPDRAERAILVEGAGARLADTFVELDRTVNRLNHLQQGDLLRFAGEGHAAACTARGVEQPGDGKLRNDLGKE